MAEGGGRAQCSAAQNARGLRERARQAGALCDGPPARLPAPARIRSWRRSQSRPSASTTTSPSPAPSAAKQHRAAAKSRKRMRSILLRYEVSHASGEPRRCWKAAELRDGVPYCASQRAPPLRHTSVGTPRRGFLRRQHRREVVYVTVHPRPCGGVFICPARPLYRRSAARPH